MRLMTPSAVNTCVGRDSCWDIIPELAPLLGEPIIDKPGKGFTAPISTCFCTSGTFQNIVLAGITTDVCVHTTMRDANDRASSACSFPTAPARPITATISPL